MASNDEEASQQVAPVAGSKTIEEALSIINEGSTLTLRWLDSQTISVDPLRVQLPRAEHVTVLGARLPVLAEFTEAPVVVIDRERIRDIGEMRR